MNIARRMSVSTTSALAYTLLITAFAALGVFVATLALGSGWAVGTGLTLVACLAGSVLGFRAAGRKLAQAETAEPSNASIFVTPLRRDEIDRYLETYRATATTLALVEPMRRSGAEHHEPALLSA
jgi:hypothetical protein